MGTLLRLLVLRWLPRRLVPLLLVWDMWRLWRNRQRRYYGSNAALITGPVKRRRNTW